MDRGDAAIAWASPWLCWSGAPHPPSKLSAAQRGIAPKSARWVSRVPRGRPIRDINELLLERTDLLQQANWVQHGPQLVHSMAHLLARAWVRHQPLTGCRWGVIAFPDQCPIARLGGQLEGGLEEIHEQPHRSV